MALGLLELHTDCKGLLQEAAQICTEGNDGMMLSVHSCAAIYSFLLGKVWMRTVCIV